MVLMTKCILHKPSADDGFRISVMRIYDQKKHPEYQDVDAVWRDLGPSKELLKDYVDGLSWGEYVKRYTAEVIVENYERVKELAILAKQRDVTILCLEDSPEFCHRRLLAEVCKQFDPNLKVIVK